MDKATKIISGTTLTTIILILVLPGMPFSSWGKASLELIKGSITIFLLLAGIVLTAIGISELRE